MTIQDLIKAAGTRGQAATVAAVQRDTIQRWLRGGNGPNWRQFLALCRATDTDPMTVTDDPATLEPALDGKS